MRYLLLIYQDEVAHSQWSEEELAAEYQDYFAFGAETEKLGVSAGDALLPTNTATTVRVRNGKILTTRWPIRRDERDGFFAITYEIAMIWTRLSILRPRFWR